MIKFLTSIFIAIFASTVFSDRVTIAVSSNFANPMNELVTEFEKKFDHKVIVSIGSTGKHYRQILSGAPFDIFFSADKKHTDLLLKKGKGIKESKFIYAIGQLVLWSKNDESQASLQHKLKNKKNLSIAMANHRIAPYGRAAQETLSSMGLWSFYKKNIVRGENVAQAFHFGNTGAVSHAFVALSQVMKIEGVYWIIPQNHYSPIEQSALLIKKNNVSKSFVNFVKSDIGKRIIQKWGYDLP